MVVVSMAVTEVAIWLVCVIPVAVMNVTATELAVWLVIGDVHGRMVPSRLFVRAAVKCPTTDPIKSP